MKTVERHSIDLVSPHHKAMIHLLATNIILYHNTVIKRLIVFEISPSNTDSVSMILLSTRLSDHADCFKIEHMSESYFTYCAR